MKKSITIILIVAILVIATIGFCGCVYDKRDSMFVIIEEANNYTIVYHKETLVMYAVSTGRHNCGTFTLLVNADGTPMLYEEGEE